MSRKKLKKYFMFIAVAVLLIFLFSTESFAPLRFAIQRASSPVLGYFYRIGRKLDSSYKDSRSNVDYKGINIRLQAEVNKLTADNAKLKALEDENKTLKNHLSYSTKYKAKYVLANVISFSDQSGVNQQIMIDRGKADGVKPGLAVVSDSGIAVGKVERSDEGISFVSLSASKQCKFAASIQNSAKTSGIAFGDLGLTIKMDFIPLNEEIKEGQLAVTSGLEREVPRGIVIGRISKINKANNELWQNAVIEPLVKPSDLIIVSVLVP